MARACRHVTRRHFSAPRSIHGRSNGARKVRSPSAPDTSSTLTSPAIRSVSSRAIAAFGSRRADRLGGATDVGTICNLPAGSSWHNLRAPRETARDRDRLAIASSGRARRVPGKRPVPICHTRGPGVCDGTITSRRLPHAGGRLALAIGRRGSARLASVGNRAVRSARFGAFRAVIWSWRNAMASGRTARVWRRRFRGPHPRRPSASARRPPACGRRGEHARRVLQAAVIASRELATPAGDARPRRALRSDFALTQPDSLPSPAAARHRTGKRFRSVSGGRPSRRDETRCRPRTRRPGRCFSRTDCTMPRWMPRPRPWMSRTSVEAILRLRGLEVLVNDGRNVTRRERMQIEFGLDRNDMGVIVHCLCDVRRATCDVRRAAVRRQPSAFLNSATTVVVMPPRAVKAPVTVMRRGPQAATRSSRILVGDCLVVKMP